MSIQREIVHRLLESRGLSESEFSAGGSTYKCVFGKYYKDGEEITRDEYFKAKDGSPSTTQMNTQARSYEDYTSEEFDNELDQLEAAIYDVRDELSVTHPESRDTQYSKLEDYRKKLSAMEEYLSDEQMEVFDKLLDDIISAEDISYEREEW